MHAGHVRMVYYVIIQANEHKAVKSGGGTPGEPASRISTADCLLELGEDKLVSE